MSVFPLSDSVLVVDDSWFLATQVETWLGEENIAVAGTAVDLRGALAIADAHRPGFALVDYNLNGVMATDLIAELTRRGVKVIVITGYSDLRPEVADAVLVKPCTKQQVVQALRKAGFVN